MDSRPAFSATVLATDSNGNMPYIRGLKQLHVYCENQFKLKVATKFPQLVVSVKLVMPYRQNKYCLKYVPFSQTQLTILL